MLSRIGENLIISYEHMGEVIAMDDNQKDVAIIEASALLVTLIFIILSFYSSNYAMYYTTWQQRCTLNPQECAWPPCKKKSSLYRFGEGGIGGYVLNMTIRSNGSSNIIGAAAVPTKALPSATFHP